MPSSAVRSHLVPWHPGGTVCGTADRRLDPAMQRHHFAVHLPLQAVTVEALFRSHPTTWLRRFLRLASLAASESPGDPEAPGWYRLSQPGPEGTGALEAPLTWCPHAGDVLFENFRGKFVVTGSNDGTSLVLTGEAEGGDEGTNASVLRSVLELIGAALRAAQAPDG